MSGRLTSTLAVAAALVGLGGPPAGASPDPVRPSIETGPRWTARGHLVAVERESVDGAPQVEVFAPQGGTRRVVEGYQPQIAPGGEHVLVRRREDGRERLVVLDVETGRELVLPGSLPPGEAPRWSPEGQRLATPLRVDEPTGAAGTERRAPAEVFVLDLKLDESPRLLQLTKGGGAGPRWIGTGDRLIYEVPDGHGGFDLLLRDEGGLGEPRRFWDAEPAPPAAPRLPLA